jgi:hypothetical protein
VLSPHLLVNYNPKKISHHLVRRDFTYRYQVSSNNITLVGEYQTSSSTGLTGLEPATSRVTGARSNQLSYSPIYSTDLIMPVLHLDVN